MISFIVIGRNEGWRLKKCIDSIYKTIHENNLSKYEIIYIDSKSTDNSLQIIGNYQEIKSYVLIQDMNAAIARNLGAEKSKGDIMFFIDGDMELIPEFLPLVYSPNEGLLFPFVSGNWNNVLYDKHGNYLTEKPFKKLKEDVRSSVTGGLFLIERTVWEEIGGMRPIFKKSQDIDLGLRLAKRGIFLIRKKEIAANHHTVSYIDNDRIWRELFNGKHFYGRSLLYRKHFFNPHIYKRIFENEKSLILLLLLIVISFSIWNAYPLLLYFPFILIRKGLNAKLFIYMIIRDLMVLLGLFLFFPKRHFSVDYKLVTNEN